MLEPLTINRTAAKLEFQAVNQGVDRYHPLLRTLLETRGFPLYMEVFSIREQNGNLEIKKNGNRM